MSFLFVFVFNFYSFAVYSSLDVSVGVDDGSYRDHSFFVIGFSFIPLQHLSFYCKQYWSWSWTYEDLPEDWESVLYLSKQNGD
jgi:hypothetical protein